MTTPGELHQPSTDEDLPAAAVVAWLDGTDLEDKVGSAVGVVTTDPDGWSRTALLSAGELLVDAGGRLLMALHHGSTTTANLRRDGRCVLTVAAGGGLHELAVRVAEQAPLTDPPLAVFGGQVARVREHHVPYAEVTGGISYTLHEPGPVIERWRGQIDALRARRAEE